MALRPNGTTQRWRAGEPLLLPIEDNPILDIVKSRMA
jgi:hypothetical protein